MAFALAFIPGCGGPAFDGHVFRNDELSFRLPGTPRGYRSIDSQGALLAFRDDGNASTIAVSGRCGEDGDDVPLAALTHHLFLEFTEREVESQENLILDGREALRTSLTAKLDGVQKRFDVFVLKKNGCVYDFMLVARPGPDDEGRKVFEEFVEGFSTIAP